MTASLSGASVWEDELYQLLQTHMEDEHDLVERYQALAWTSPSAAFRYVASLIVEDERRHHRFLSDLAQSLRAEAEMRPEAPLVPRVDFRKADRAEIAAATDELLAHERADARHLREIGTTIEPLKDTSLWSLLVRVMEADTAKHIEILKFVKAHLDR